MAMTNDERIRLRAYEIWINEGMPEGRELEHWTQARREVSASSALDGDDRDLSAETAPPPPVGAELKKSAELG